MLPENSPYVALLAEAFAKRGLPPEWGPAIAHQESRFDPNAKALTGGDGRRGGAYGLCQMTFKTAQGMGFAGEPEELLDPHLNALLAAHLCSQLAKRYNSSLLDVASAYNCGRPFSKAPPSSQTYATNVVRYAALYQYSPNVMCLADKGTK